MSRIAAAGAAVAAALLLTVSAVPAGADVLPPPGCNTTCTATFDTLGSSFEFDVPAGITNLKVTVAGGAGDDADSAQGAALGGIGGAGGVTTVDLGTTYAGQTLIFGVGGTGAGSYLQSGLNVLIIAGGGGQGGYLGRFDLSDPDQVFAGYPGGAGGAPTAPGVTNGEAGTALSPNPANGGGGEIGGGDAGLGTTNGNPGDPTAITSAAGTDLAAGGAGANAVMGELPRQAGDGGTGYSGGGGGAIASVPAEPTDNGLAAPGGGGAGFLALGLTGVAGTNATATGSVSFTYTFPALPATGSSVPTWIPLTGALLLVMGAATLIAVRRRSNA